MTRLIRTARALRITAAANWFATIVLASLLVAGTLDFLLDLRDVGSRVLLSSVVLGVQAFAVRRLLYPVASERWNATVVALRVEQFFPPLRNRLACALDFLQAGASDATAGSWPLRQALIAEAEQAARALDFRQVLDVRSCWRPIGSAVFVVWLVIASAVVAPETVAQAMRRLATPWQHDPWPSVNRLRWEAAPSRMALGGEGEFTVVDARGRPLESVRLLVVWDGADDSQAETFEMQRRDSAFTHRLEQVTKSFRVRAVGGDDDSMPWFVVRVVEPPRLESVELTVIPPEYSRRPPSPAGQTVRAIVGSRLELVARFDRDVESARVRLVESLSRSGEGADPVGGSSSPSVTDVEQLPVRGRELRIGRSENGASSAGPSDWPIGQSGTYALEVTDAGGLRVELARWLIEALPDRPPGIEMTRPGAASTATKRAQLKFTGRAQDDVGVAKVELLVRREGASESDSRRIAANLSTQAAEEASWDAVWALEAEPGMDAGQTWEFSVVATDLAGQTARTTWRRIDIVSDEELNDQIARRLAVLLGLLQESLRLQNQARDAARAASAPEDGKPRGSIAEGPLASSLTLQRQVPRSLGREPAGAIGASDEILKLLEENRSERQELVQQLRGVVTTLGRLVDDTLPTLEHQLGSVIRSLTPQTPTSDVEPRLIEVASGQEGVSATLGRLIADLNSWEDHRRFLREANRLRREQESLHAEVSARLAAATSGQRLGELRRLSERQGELARQVEQFLRRMAEMHSQVAKTDHGVADTLDGALRAARDGRLHVDSVEAGRSLQQARIGQSAQAQRRAIATWQTVIDRLSRPDAGSNDPANSQDAHDKSAGKPMGAGATGAAAAWGPVIEKLASRQRTLVAQWSDVSSDTTALAWSALQKALADESRLETNSLPPMPLAGLALRIAVRDMQAASDYASRATPEVPRDALVATRAESAARRLEELANLLRSPAASIPDAKPDETQTPADKSSGAAQQQKPDGKTIAVGELQLVRTLQLELRQRTAAIEAARGPNGRLPAARQRELSELAADQQELANLLKSIVGP